MLNMAMSVSLVAAILLVTVGCSHGSEEEDIERTQCYDTICWNQDDYPATEIMTKLYEENENNTDIFGEYQSHAEALRLEEASCNLCKYKTSLRISPVTLKDGDDIYFVVRTENYENNITLTICESEEIQKKESKCMNIDESQKHLDHSMACEQKFTTIKFLVYDKKNEKFIEKTLQYPSECVCAIQKTD